MGIIVKAIDAVLSILSFVQTYPSPPMMKQLPKAPYFILAGDSTTASQSSDGGGWGDGFLNTTLFEGACGRNFGHNGATTVRFRDEGRWDNVIGTVRQVEHDYDPFVTIQFGHNDQLPAAKISLSQYISNLERFVTEAFAAGATPILVTPLSRLRYDDSTARPNIVMDLADETMGTITAAYRSNATYIDLNQASTQYLNEIGPENASTYNLNPTDFNHLNVPGSILFGGIVAELIIQKLDDLEKFGYLRVNGKLKEDVDHGIYHWP
ncbi:Esterase SGNH hydrolase-type subgroup [Penicillium concentricum]|uniref:Esterase SGNH hydrolase-type subgroup n=1 Tax=Penicillium concentricum TaxID=293559 RepID=A0A9W9VDY2_9EURO|nr:Esterase SGNH hydrolase-type subgroup [Penicillium concentricum]KAJ5375866.1 Esterase SGNH hydrolase-type subgroup [Penicillium concentricum]